MSKKPILITGSHRSGSTWVGTMIAESPSVQYIHEPFNIDHPPSIGICSAKFQHWYTYISEKNADYYQYEITKMLNFQYNLANGIKAISSRRQALQILREYKSSVKNRILKTRPLVKDPIAFFSAEWLAQTFDMDVIVLIRHPAAFASSIKAKNWGFPFSHFLEQPLLMKDYLYEFEDDIKAFAKNEYNIIDQASLLWKIIHSVILKYQVSHKNWIFARHEDISRDPLSEYQIIFNRLKLQYTSKIQKVISDYSNLDNQDNKDSLKRNSKLNISKWKSILTNTEIKQIKSQVSDVSQHLYSESDW